MLVDAGFLPLVIDCFADVDTRILAEDTIKVASLQLEELRPALQLLAKTHDFSLIAYGSGFEEHPDSLEYLQQHWQLLGNSAEVFGLLLNKTAFFRQLSELDIPYPETRFNPPAEDGDWLFKPLRSLGGQGIQPYIGNPKQHQTRGYWQRRQAGAAMSASFVACRGYVQVLGFNRQWTRALDAQNSYIFAGIANQASLPAKLQQQLTGWLSGLATVYSLQGLGSLDFILADEKCYVLEINARIPASACLYGKSVFIWHMLASLGKLDSTLEVPSQPMAYQILFADTDILTPAAINWPAWAQDLPESGAIIGKGQPICSIIASGKNPRLVSELLAKRQHTIEQILTTGT